MPTRQTSLRQVALPDAHLLARAALLLFAALFPALLSAQQQTAVATPPVPPPVQPVATPQPQSPEPASLKGLVRDKDGALIPGADVALDNLDGTPERRVTSDSEGRFSFTRLRPGRYTVTVSSPGFEPFTSSSIPLRPGEDALLLTVTLGVHSAHADIYVTLTRKEQADDQVHAAEHQRIIGFPDFYTSFVWNAAPLDSRQKLSLGLHATTDRMAFVTAAIVASAEQINGTFPGYGPGREGFAKRYGAAYADGFIGKFIGGAIFPSIFRQDPRYFYMGPENGTVRQRAWHAITSGFLTRGDNGHLQPNYSHVLGNASAGALSTLYHPAADSAGKLALDNALLGTVGEAGVNLLREFLLKRFVRGIPPGTTGKP